MGKISNKVAILDSASNSTQDAILHFNNNNFDVVVLDNIDQRKDEIANINCAVVSQVTPEAALDYAQMLRKLVSKPHLPVIFVISRNDSIKCFATKHDNAKVLLRSQDGKIDYQTLIVVMKDLIKKSSFSAPSKLIKYNNIEMDLNTYSVWRQGNIINLGPTEFKILQLFLEQPQKVHSRQSIIELIWGKDSHVSNRTVDVHINRIRSLIKLPTDRYPIIQTIRSLGYCLE